MKNDIFREEGDDRRDDAGRESRPRRRGADKSGPGALAVILSIVALLLLVGAVLYGAGMLGGDEAVAIVNGEEISESTLNDQVDQQLQLLEEQLTQQAATQPQLDVQAEIENARPMVQEQSLVTLINQRLLTQAAEEAGIQVSEAQVDEALQQQTAQIGGEQALEARLNDLGATRAELREILHTQLLVEAYVDSQTDEEIVASDTEVQALYDAYVAQLESQAGTSTSDAIPSLSEIRPDLEQEVILRERQEILNELLRAEQAEADVEVLIPGISYPPEQQQPVQPPAEVDTAPETEPEPSEDTATATDSSLDTGDADGAAADAQAGVDTQTGTDTQ